MCRLLSCRSLIKASSRAQVLRMAALVPGRLAPTRVVQQPRLTPVRARQVTAFTHKCGSLSRSTGRPPVACLAAPVKSISISKRMQELKEQNKCEHAHPRCKLPRCLMNGPQNNLCKRAIGCSTCRICDGHAALQDSFHSLPDGRGSRHGHNIQSYPNLGQARCRYH